MNSQISKNGIFIPQMFDAIDEDMILASETTAKILPEIKKKIIIAVFVAILILPAAFAGGYMIMNGVLPVIPPISSQPDTTTPNSPTDDFDIENGTLISYLGSESEIAIPQGVVRVSSTAFANATTVKVIYLPKTLEEIDEGAFTACPNLERVDTGDNQRIVTVNGFVLTNNGSEILYLNKDGQLPIVRVPAGVVKIPDGFLEGNTMIEKLILPDTVQNIGIRAFSQCPNLKEASLGEVKFIMKEAFSNSPLEKLSLGSSLIIIEKDAFIFTSLSSVTIPATIEMIGPSAFYHTNIDTVVYQGTKDQFEGVAHFFRDAFKNFDDISLLFYTNDPSPNSLQFFSNGDGSCTVTPSPSKENSGEVIIPQKSPQGEVVTAIRDFNDCKKITSIILPDSVNTLPQEAFKGCIMLESVKLSDNTKIIPKNAFLGCNSLVYFDFPKALERIEEGAFHQNPNFTRLVFPDGVKYIGKNAFDFNLNVELIDLSKTSLERIESGAFAGCHKLTTLLLPSCLKQLDELVFASCLSLKEVNLPDGITYLGNRCFEYTPIVSIVIPSSVKTMDGCFYGCSSLESITLPSNLEEISSQLFYQCTSLKQIDLPQTVKSVGASAFEGSAIKSIVLPRGVTVIEDRAFGYCLDLGSVTFEGVITHIGKEAFAGSAISEIQLSEGLKTIDQAAFINCDGLVSVVFPPSIESVSQKAFYGCDNLKGVTFSKGITSIGSRCFEACKAIEEIILPNSLTTLGEYAFGSCSSLTKVVLSSNLKEIANYTFIHCTSLEKITLPPLIERIGVSAFDHSALSEVTLPNSVKLIDKNAFLSCPYLDAVVIEGSAEIKSNAFATCPKLKTVTFKKAPLFNKANDVFAGCPLLWQVNIEEGEMDLSSTSRIFANCSSLRQIDFQKISSLGYGAFTNCTSLPKVIVLAPSVTLIPTQAFMGCSFTEKIVLPKGTLTIEPSAFADCTSLVEFTLPSTIENMGSGAFENTNIKTVNFIGTKQQWDDLDVAMSKFNKHSYTLNLIPDQ